MPGYTVLLRIAVIYTLCLLTSIQGKAQAGDVLLPVSTDLFTANLQGQQVMLRWQGSKDKGYIFYVVQHSADGLNWKSLREISVVTDYDIQNYNYADSDPCDGFNYYRLQKLDIDSSATYSEIRAVKFDNIPNVSMYPNPFKGSEIYISIRPNLYPGLQYTIADLSGKVCQNGYVPTGTHAIETAGLTNGIYLVIFSNGKIMKILRDPS